MKNIILYLFVILFVFSCTPKKQETSASIQSWLPKDTSWKQLSLREKIGQTMLMKIDVNKELRIGNGSYKTYFEKYPVGGFFLANWIIKQYIPADSVASYIHQQIELYKSNSKTPLFFQEDFENGIGGSVNGFTQLPNLMGLGATADTALAYKYGKTIALEARSLGMNWLLHPVADLNMNPLNSVVTSRSISDNPDLAIKLLTKQIEAMQQQGIAATIKHFPGDGVDYRDQHMVTTENTLKMDKWWQLHGKVFQALINAGASSVMLGHIRLTDFQKEKINGFTPPATLSKELIDLLKVTMGFNGVVVSDALDMGGIQQYYPTRISTQVACFAAGCDVLLWPEEGYMDTLEAKILNNEIPMSRLDDAVSRIWALKEKLGMLDKNYQTFIPISDTDKIINKQTTTTIAEKSITMVWDKNILPIKPGTNKRVLFQVVSQPGNMKNFQTSIDALKEKGFNVDTALSTQYFDLRSQETEKYDYMIFAFYRFPFNPFSSKILEGTEAFKVWLISSLPQNKIITISYGDPYIHHRYFERVGASINAYGTDKETQKAVIKALTGDIPFNGQSPVTLFDPH